VNYVLKLVAFVQSHAATLRHNERGQTMAEYGVILAVITLGIVLALGVLSGAIQSAIGSVVERLNGAS
jgi:Flp pilus assembly pilin Flp